MSPDLLLKRPSFWERLIRLVYPAKCMVCDTLLREDCAWLICDTCHKTIPRYGKGFHKTPELPYVNGLLAPFYYDQGVDTAIHHMKFNHQPRLSNTMACLIYEQIVREACFPDFDLIIPVPMHPRKKRQRGYNQSELVAKELSVHLKVPVRTDLLIKTRYTRPQSRLKREERLHNMNDAYIVRKSDDVAGKNILLVDDVTTTGTTLNTCAKMLNENGAAYIFAAVIARAEK